MKKLLFLLLLIPSIVSAGPLQQKHLAVIAALNNSSATCTSYEVQSSTSGWSFVGQNSNRGQIGTVYVAPATVDVCKLVFSMYAVTATAATYDYYAAIYTMNGTALNVRQGKSSAVTITQSDVAYDFLFATSVPLTNGVSYGIVVFMDLDANGEPDYDEGEVDYAGVRVNSSSVSPLDHADEMLTGWRTDNSYWTEWSDYDVKIEVWTDQ